MATIEKELIGLAAIGITAGIVIVTAPERISKKIREKQTGVKEQLSDFAKDSLDVAKILLAIADS